MDRQQNVLTPEDWRKVTDEVIKLSERVEAIAPQKPESDRKRECPPHSK